MSAFGKDMKLYRDSMFHKCISHFQSIFYWNRLIRKCVPNKHRWCTSAYLFLSRYQSQQFHISCSLAKQCFE